MSCRLNRAALWAVAFLAFVTAAPLAGDDPPAEEPQLPPEIAAFRRQLWSAKPEGQAFRLAVTDQTATETARWVLAERPDLPFSDPEIRIYPGGLSASATAEVLGQRIRVRGLARITVGEEGRPELDVAELTVAGVETPEVFLAPVRSALERAEESFRRLPLLLEGLELEVGKATATGTFKPLRRDHLPPPPDLRPAPPPPTGRSTAPPVPDRAAGDGTPPPPGR
jgi:hypothetical protein